MSGFVYFQEQYKVDESAQPQRLIYIGFTDNGNEYSRQNSHNGAGRALIAAIQAEPSTEKSIHNRFKQLRVQMNGSKSTYRAEPELTHWIDHLLFAKWAGKTFADARQLGFKPYSSWQPDSPITFANPNGEGLFPHQVPPRKKRPSEHGPNNSDSDDWFTPPDVVDSCRRVLGHIMTDPATCAEANECVKAKYWYTIKNSGLIRNNPWVGPMFMNPPYGDKKLWQWLDRVREEYDAGNVREAILILNLATKGDQQFEPVWQILSAVAETSRRIDFIRPQADREQQASSPNKNTVFVYIGEKTKLFCRIFESEQQCRIYLPWGGSS